MNQPKISVIMPVYNVARYLKDAIESVLNQTLGDIELICVDDASTDGSADILREYEQQDVRVRAIYFKQNKGSVAVRKRAVQEASGQYLMMLDSDDTFESTACETVWREMQRDPVDILCFATDVTACGDIPDGDAAALMDRLKPYQGTIRGDFLAACYKQQKLTQTLWNKAYSATLCKKAFLSVKDTYRTISDDLYISFIMLHFTRSYRGIPEKLYKYYLGRGISGHYSMPQNRFFTLSETCTICDDLVEFLDTQRAKKADYELVDMLKSRILDDVIYAWCESITLKDAPVCYQKMLKDWGGETVIPRLAREHWYKWPAMQKRVITASNVQMARRGKAVKTIGLFYYRIANGGIERVISLTLPRWVAMGYRVVLITEEAPSANDYPIPENITRVRIPSRLEAIQGRYKTRYDAWETIIKQYQIDTIVYCAWCDPALFWDALTLHALNTNLIGWVHGAFSHLFRLHDVNRYELVNNYFLIDRAVTLSHTFVAFFRNYCPSYYIPNPIALPSQAECSTTDGYNIVWVGRLDRDKHPEHALRAFAQVEREIPQATLTMVGAGENDAIEKELKELAKELSITEKVNFAGFAKDPTAYYKRAALLLFTTAHEGFGMVLAEAKGHGLPTVMYDLDYLELVRDKRGVITVPYGDIDSLAREIVSLLRADDDRKEIGKQARRSAAEFAGYDFQSAWQEVFDSFEKPIAKEHLAEPDTASMLHLLLSESKIGEPVVSRTDEEDRLLNSKFRILARKYWYWKEWILRKAARIHLR